MSPEDPLFDQADQETQTVEEKKTGTNVFSNQPGENGNILAANSIVSPETEESDIKKIVKDELENARQEAALLIKQAEVEKERILSEAEKSSTEIEKDAYEKGFDKGSQEGIEEGEKEISRLLIRLQAILTEASDLRGKMMNSAEEHMIETILLIARKIIKDEVSNRKDVVINNIRSALKKIRGQEDIRIRVNLADEKITAEKKSSFIQKLEKIKNIQIIEDSRVSQGGCIIESDIGSIDATVETQFNEIEKALRSINPS